MEIILLPYMAISFSIAWAIFSPFAKIDDLQEWTFARIETSDLFAIFLPLSFLWAVVKWTTPDDVLSVPVLAFFGTAIFLLTFFGLVAGLFLLAKMYRTPPVKRMAVIGIIMPLGSLLTIAWIALPMLAYAGSILYAIPAILSVVPATLALRGLSGWVCENTIAAG